MLNVAMDRNWGSWQVVRTGNGVVDITDGVLTVSADVGDSAYLRYNMEINPDERVVFECDAMSTGGSTGPVIAIDSPVNTLRASRVIDNQTLQHISVSYQPYFNGSGRQTVSIIVGTYSSIDGAGKFKNPRLRIEKSSLGVNRILGKGLIKLDATAKTVTMSTNHQSFGLDLALETYAIRVTPSDGLSFNTNRRPHVSFSPTTTSQGSAPLVWAVSAPDINGSFVLQAHTLNGVLVNLSTTPSNREIFVELSL